MILQALAAYHTRLQEDADADVAPYGFSRQKIVFRVILNEDGSLHGIEDVRRKEGNRLAPEVMVVPGDAKSSGSGLNPGFLWDNSAYLLGVKPDDPNPQRTVDSFSAFRARHLDAEKEVDDPAFSAVCRFLENWQPLQAGSYSFLTELSGGFGVFRLRGETHHVHQRPRVLAYWNRQLGREEDEPPLEGECLVNGARTRLARLHKPMIKGVMGAQSSGAALVSFNNDAFTSYRKEQGFNAPVSQAASFQYATALNHLLSDASRQRVQIGDATVVFWTEQPTPAESFLPFVFRGGAEDDALNMKLLAMLRQIAQGRFPADFGAQDTRFFLLGLSPNASRLSVRIWEDSTLGALVANLHRHYRDLAIDLSDRDPEFPAPWQILRETARETKDVPPLLSGPLMRAILEGLPYPFALYAAILRRIRSDRQLNSVRAGMLKAYLNRNNAKEVSVSLDPDNPNPAYHLGRLFASLEKIQQDALPTINDTIKDRYFGAASATPAFVFPRLIRLSQHHLGKIENPDYRVAHERRLQEICGKLATFPSHLNLIGQGLFALGYYHQRRAIFTKKQTAEIQQEQE